MFDQLSGRLEKMVKYLRGEVKITDKALAEALKMMRLAFLEADVNYKVVKDFEARIRDKAMGGEVLGGLNPAQQVIKIVRDELAAILGGVQKPLQFSSRSPSIFMLVGLQVDRAGGFAYHGPRDSRRCSTSSPNASKRWPGSSGARSRSRTRPWPRP